MQLCVAELVLRVTKRNVAKATGYIIAYERSS